MKIKYFRAEEVKSAEALRKMYLRLMMIHHPDVGGTEEAAKTILAEYEYLRSHLSFTENSGESENTNRAETIINDDRIREIIDAIIHMAGINIEIIGTWIWVDGNTYPWKEELKAYGFRWSRKRKKWHYTPYSSAKYYRGNRSFDSIRRTYGSEKVENTGARCLA